MLTDEIWMYLGWWNEWTMGLGLPYGGNKPVDEPGPIYEAIRICQETKIEVENDNQRKEAREVERQKRESERPTTQTPSRGVRLGSRRRRSWNRNNIR